nr:PREDICTED: uncharacterized protein LOC105265265 [Fopius arisanus]
MSYRFSPVSPVHDPSTDDDRECDGHMIWQCHTCSYKSKRRFNVRRHEGRIHVKKIRRKCCGQKLKTKWDWYQHCASLHPGKRPASVVSSNRRIQDMSMSSAMHTLQFHGNSSDTSDSTLTCPSPTERRYSARIRQQVLKRIETPQLFESSDDEGSHSRRESTAIENSRNSQEDSMMTRNPDPFPDINCEFPQNFGDHLRENESSCLEYQLVLSDHLGLNAFIEEVPLNPHDEPHSDFLQGLENPDISGDLPFNQEIDCEAETQPQELQSDQVALVLEQITQDNICNTNYVSSLSQALWEKPRDQILQVDLENQLPPKKKILRKFLGCNETGDKENAPPGESWFKVEPLPWNEITEMQRNFLSSFDFERYKLL